jgi:hypothetical protein
VRAAARRSTLLLGTMHPASSTYLALLLICLSVRSAHGADERSILLRVRVTDVAFTDYYPDDDCFSRNECIPFNFWFRYSAHVREVVRGNFSQPSVKFANLQHVYFRRKPSDWFVLLVPCGPSVRDAVNVEYCVRDQAFAGDRVGRERLLDAQHGALTNGSSDRGPHLR